MSNSDSSVRDEPSNPLERCFSRIRRMLMDKVPPMEVVQDSNDLVELRTPGRGEEGTLFARLSKGGDEVNLQLISVGVDMNGAHALTRELAASRRGAHQFAFHTLEEGLAEDVDRMLGFRFSICQARRLI